MTKKKKNLLDAAPEFLYSFHANTADFHAVALLAVYYHALNYTEQATKLLEMSDVFEK